ncbi:hypothetical protein LEM8419_03170 [Neolewinella maritima]|uniref:T9SS type A sorting domain-containing protein n=1 Tax=Neolewinella maritima TaxID=1383882 RepID=A0ABM9B4J1_9BACT|nr:hypothetical protein [Neolewinella maritima]CAH1002252.1 hypothetical protein LEM8419_03170 [Neolewinella maritima]
MKTLFISFLLVFALTSVSASVNPIDLVLQTDPTSHTLTLRTTVAVSLDTKVQLKDRDGLVLHTTKLSPGDYLNGRFKLDALPNGNYFVEVTDAQGKTVQPFTINRTGIDADPALATRTFYPRVNLTDKLLTINYLNTTGSSTRILLADAQGQQVITDQLPESTTVQRAYSLENLPAGEYYVTVSSADVPSYTTSLRLD